MQIYANVVVVVIAKQLFSYANGGRYRY